MWEALIAAAAEDPEFAADLAEIERQVAEKLPSSLREKFRLEEVGARARDLLKGERDAP